MHRAMYALCLTVHVCYATDLSHLMTRGYKERKYTDQMLQFIYTSFCPRPDFLDVYSGNALLCIQRVEDIMLRVIPFLFRNAEQLNVLQLTDLANMCDARVDTGQCRGIMEIRRQRRKCYSYICIDAVVQSLHDGGTE